MVKVYLILLIFFAFFFPRQIFAHSSTQIIEMTTSGFQPDSVTVDQNSTIIFLNKDSVARWPASNIHPTHELYPEFDPKKPIQPGQSWPFKPKNVGTWKYHDHLFPHMRGVVNVNTEEGTENESVINNNTEVKIVEEKEGTSFIESIKEAFNNIWMKIKEFFSFNKKSSQQKKALDISIFIKLSYDKQEKEIKEIAESNGSEKAWKYLNEVFKGKAGSSGNIHDLAHLAGSLIYQDKNFEGLGNCSTDFAFGCYHGFLDTAFAKSLDSLPDAESACLKLNPKNTNTNVAGPAASCIHGIGHGIASYYSTNDLKTALKTCRRLIVGHEYCFDGVFMEFVRNAKDSFFKIDDPLYPCNKLENEFGYAYSFACGRNQPSLLMGRFGIGFDEIISICLSSSSRPFKEACFDSLGFSLASQENTEKIIAGCQKIGTNEFVLRCLKAAAGEMVFQKVPNWWEKSQKICNATLDGQGECNAHVERLISEYGRQRKFNFAPLEDNGDPNAYIRKQMKVCYDINGRDGCYKQVAQALFDQFGLAETLTLLRENEQHPEVYARCHEATHYLSRNEYDKQKSIAKIYAQCDSTCHGGCYHGTLEAFLKEQQSKANYSLITEFSKVCGKQENYQKPLEFYECLHGLGHAAMFVTDMELMESLKLCDTLNNNIYEDKCYTGVFMENSSSSTSFDHKSIYIKEDDPFYPCNILSEKHQPMCWQYQSSYFSVINNQDWKKVADMCLQIPQIYQDRCFRTIGTNQVGFTTSFETMKKDCDQMPNAQFKNICITGVISSLSYRFVGDTQKMIDFCSTVDTQNKESCFKQMGTSLLDWNFNKELAKKECRKVSDTQGAYWCLNAI